jgi:hypothetical protein
VKLLGVEVSLLLIDETYAAVSTSSFVWNGQVSLDLPFRGEASAADRAHVRSN